MDVVLQSRTPKYGIGRIHPKTAAGHGCIALLLLGTVKNGGITVGLFAHGSCGGDQHSSQRPGEHQECAGNEDAQAEVSEFVG